MDTNFIKKKEINKSFLPKGWNIGMNCIFLLPNGGLG